MIIALDRQLEVVKVYCSVYKLFSSVAVTPVRLPVRQSAPTREPAKSVARKGFTDRVEKFKLISAKIPLARPRTHFGGNKAHTGPHTDVSDLPVSSSASIRTRG